MKQVLTPGRWRGLRATSTANNTFNILAFDQRGTYRKMLPEGSSPETAVKIKRQIVVELSTHVSAVLLDAEYGLEPALAMAGHTGLLMALEKSGYSGDSTYRQAAFVDGWTVGTMKQIGVTAVKLLAYYHPESAKLAEETETLIQQVVNDCHAHDLPVFVEPMSYSLDANVVKESAEFAKTRPRIVAETARRLSKLNIDVLKMEFPVDADFDSDHKSWQSACESLSGACTAPWVLLSAGVDFSTFAEQLMIACRAGASGYLAGRTIWKESVAMDDDSRQRFLQEIAVERLNKLNDTANSQARPWSDFYEPMSTSPEWWNKILEPQR